MKRKRAARDCPRGSGGRRALKTNVLDGKSAMARARRPVDTSRVSRTRNPATPPAIARDSRLPEQRRRRRHRGGPGRGRHHPAAEYLRSAQPGTSLHPQRSGGYNVTRIDGNFRATLGTRLTLDDDDSAPSTVPFGFSFYGKAQTAAFVNSDGNITFEEADKSSTDRNVARLLTGPPRVAPFLADLDPTAGTAGFSSMPRRTSTPSPGATSAASTRRAPSRVQTTLLPDGTIEMIYGASINIGDAIVGLSPGPHRHVHAGQPQRCRHRRGRRRGRRAIRAGCAARPRRAVARSSMRHTRTTTISS